MLDISVTARKAHVAKYAASFEPSVGPAGFEKTRREPPTLTDRQYRTLDQFCALVPKARRSTYRAAVLARLSGSPGDAAVDTACLNAAREGGYIANRALAENFGFVALESDGSIRPRRNDGYQASWRSKAIRGVGR
jgi:hypothetical protein